MQNNKYKRFEFLYSNLFMYNTVFRTEIVLIAYSAFDLVSYSVVFSAHASVFETTVQLSAILVIISLISWSKLSDLL